MFNFQLEETFSFEFFNLENFSPNTSFTQSDFYGDWQKKLNRKVIKFVIKNNGEVVAYFQVIKYPLLKNKSYFYIPFGPVVRDIQDFSSDFLFFLKKELIALSKKEIVAFVRLDFNQVVEDRILKKYFRKSPRSTYHSAYFQPRNEWFLGLKEEKEILLKNMSKNARYSIHLAFRKDINTEIITKDFMNYFEDFYNLMNITAKRNGFSLHEKSYYKNIFQDLENIKDSYLSIARFEDKILAIDMVIVFSGIANYVFGGSSNEERNRMPTYLAQWEAICYAKELGCEFYNFGGIGDSKGTYKGWDGLSSYKRKFGGMEIRHSDFFDLIVSPVYYFLYSFRKWWKRIFK